MQAQLNNNHLNGDTTDTQHLELTGEHIDVFIHAFVYSQRAAFASWMDTLGLGESQKDKLMHRIEKSRNQIESAKLIDHLSLDIGLMTEERREKYDEKFGKYLKNKC